MSVHPRSRYGIYLADCTVTYICVLHLDVTLSGSHHEGAIAHTLSHTLQFRQDFFSASATVSGHRQFTQRNYVALVTETENTSVGKMQRFEELIHFNQESSKLKPLNQIYSKGTQCGSPCDFECVCVCVCVFIYIFIYMQTIAFRCFVNELLN